jgi:hypothetical protein
MGMGARVPLEFDANVKVRCASKRGTGSTGIGLFPGMIVALKGRNGSGDSFVVSEILRVCMLQAPSIMKRLNQSILRYPLFCRAKQIFIHHFQRSLPVVLILVILIWTIGRLLRSLMPCAINDRNSFC